MTRNTISSVLFAMITFILSLVLSGCSNKCSSEYPDGSPLPGCESTREEPDTATPLPRDTGEEADTDTDTDSDSDTDADTDSDSDSDTDTDSDTDSDSDRPFAENGIWFQRPDLSRVNLHPVGSLLQSAFTVADRDVAYEYDCRMYACETLPVFQPSADNTRCYGDSELEDISGYLNDVPFPVGEQVLVGVEGDESTPNNHISIVAEDGVTGYELNWSATCETPSGAKYLAGWSQRAGDPPEIDYTGDGLAPGGRGGSYLTAAVNVRGEELAQCELAREDLQLIDHAVFGLLWSSVLHYDSSDTESPGHTRLAWTQDTSAPTYYTGTDPYLTMGSYLILDQAATFCDSMVTTPGYLLCKAYQMYGGPVGDDSWTPGRFSFGVDQFARADVLASCGFDLQGAYAGDSNYAQDIQAILGGMHVILEDELDEAFPGFVFPGNE